MKTRTEEELAFEYLADNGASFNAMAANMKSDIEAENVKSQKLQFDLAKTIADARNLKRQVAQQLEEKRVTDTLVGSDKIRQFQPPAPNASQPSQNPINTTELRRK